MEVEGGLAVGGAGERFLRAGAEDGGEVGRKDAGAEFEDFAGGGGAFGEVGPHADPLGSLAGEEKGNFGHTFLYKILNTN